jgi:hypothetical protein
MILGGDVNVDEKRGVMRLRIEFVSRGIYTNAGWDSTLEVLWWYYVEVPCGINSSLK